MELHDYLNDYNAAKTLYDKHAKLAREHKQRMDLARARAGALLHKIGATSINTPYGTPVNTEKTVANVTDWGLFSDWIVTHDMTSLLQRRVNNGAYSDLIDRSIQPDGTEARTLQQTVIRPPSS